MSNATKQRTIAERHLESLMTAISDTQFILVHASGEITATKYVRRHQESIKKGPRHRQSNRTLNSRHLNSSLEMSKKSKNCKSFHVFESGTLKENQYSNNLATKYPIFTGVIDRAWSQPLATISNHKNLGQFFLFFDHVAVW